MRNSSLLGALLVSSGLASMASYSNPVALLGGELGGIANRREEERRPRKRSHSRPNKTGPASYTSEDALFRAGRRAARWYKANPGLDPSKAPAHIQEKIRLVAAMAEQ